MEAACSSETLVPAYQTTQCYKKEDVYNEDGGDTFFQNGGSQLPDYMVL
jgi:hypothetical protein